MNNRVVVIGGGISGLAAAYYLNKAGHRATVVEKSARLGGVIRTDSRDGHTLELGPDSFLAAKRWALDLIGEVGLGDQVINSNDHLRVTYVLRGGKLVPLPDGMMMMVPTKIRPLVTTRLLSWPCKIRMGMELLRRPGGKRADRSVSAFLLDHYGQEAIDYLAEPLLSGVFGGDPRVLSVNSVLTRFVEIEEKYGSLSRGVLAAPKPPGGGGGSLFRTLKGGLGQLVEKLAPSADLVRGEAEAIERKAGGVRVRVNGAWLDAERAVVAVPAWAASKLLRPVDAAAGELLSTIPYNSSMTVTLSYDAQTFGHPLKGFGFLVPKRERAHMKACTWMNNKFHHRAAPGKVLLRCFFAADQMNQSDEAVVQAAGEDLARIMGLRATPEFSLVTRWPDSMAQYIVGHAERVEKLRGRMKEIPEILLAGNGYDGIGIPDCIRSGKLAAVSVSAALLLRSEVGDHA